MSKSISAALQTSIRNGVTTLATCVVITRRDGRIFRMTNADTDLTVDGYTYPHSIPFQLSAIDSSSALSIDNTQLTLFCDETTFTKEDFRIGMFDYAECEVFDVDYEDLTAGRMTLRRGWFGPIDRNEHGVVHITVTGLMKILDFQVGRIYQPTCDADFGDARCKLAVNRSQIYSPYNRYAVGDWVYRYEPALMTEIALTNGSFDDANKTENETINGWTKGTGTTVYVGTSATSPIHGSVGTLSPADGSRALYGSVDATSSSSGFENYVYQDVDLIANLLNPTFIDNGIINVAFYCMLAHTSGLADPVRIKCDMLDADDALINTSDSRWIFLDTAQAWRERALVFTLLPGTRKVRLYIYFRKEDGTAANGAADNARFYWYNNAASSPEGGVIFKCTRVVGDTYGTPKTTPNASFEANGTVANTNAPALTGWTPEVGSYWRVTNSFFGLSAQHGNLFLAGGDNGSGVQSTYKMAQVLYFSGVMKLDTTRLAQGKYAGQATIKVGFGDTGSTAGVMIEIMTISDVVLQKYYTSGVNYGAGVWKTLQTNFTLPASGHKIRVTLFATSPTGTGLAKVAFDDYRLYVYDIERPENVDPTYGYGDEANTIWSYTPDDVIVDGDLIWRAMPAVIGYDEVSTAADRRTFNGTDIVGVDGDYEMGSILWLSGDNAGIKNVIRAWTPGTKTMKLYFKQPHAIQSGDRFLYTRSCQKRFDDDCVLQFDNALNFRGFPHLPGKLTQTTSTEDAETPTQPSGTTDAGNDQDETTTIFPGSSGTGEPFWVY